MTLPERFKICRDKGRQTEFCGTCADGRQFLGAVLATLPPPLPRDLQAHEHWHAVLHTFDHEGHHLATRIHFTGKTRDGKRDAVAQARAKLDEFLADLGELSYGDISIRFFGIEIDGQFFGLVDNSDPVEDSEQVWFVPHGINLSPPWDGTYDS